MVQVAKRGASVLKRRKSRNRMETPSSIAAANAAAGGTSTCGTLATIPQSSNDSHASGSGQPPARSESDGDVVFYAEEPRSGKYKKNETKKKNNHLQYE